MSKGTITKLGTPDFELKSKHTRCKIPTKDPNDPVLENKYVLRKNNNGTGEICSILSTRIIKQGSCAQTQLTECEILFKKKEVKINPILHFYNLKHVSIYKEL